jgi:hypothetical protein
MRNVTTASARCHAEPRRSISAEAFARMLREPQHDTHFSFSLSHVLFTKAIGVTILLLFGSFSFAQSAYDNAVYRPEIKSVEFYNSSKKASFPIIMLGSNEKVILAFDNLLGGTQSYSYTIEHCDANWNSSNISTAEYLKSYNDDKITDYSYSTTTVQKYTHYELKLPNDNIAPKIPGNYVLKVYEDGDQSKLILTRKLYVVRPGIGIRAEIVPSNDNSTRQTNQKINFTLDYGNLRVQNPGTDLRTLIMQNARSETTIVNTQPTYIRSTQLVFSDVSQNDFPAGNEFRHIDTRSLKIKSERIARIIRGDTSNNILLLTDPDLGQPPYSFQYDLNGSFYVLNSDGIDPRTDADYAHVYFTLSTKSSPDEGTPYVVGQFNDYKPDDNSKMHFDASTGKFVSVIFLKQGVYDYTYVWVDKAGKTDDITLEGSHYETENDYQVLVYYRPPGARWEELIGYKVLNSANKN